MFNQANPENHDLDKQSPIKGIDRTKKNKYFSVKQIKPAGKNTVAAVKRIEPTIIAANETVIPLNLPVKRIKPSVKNI